jgi:hypothetical protein
MHCPEMEPNVSKTIPDKNASRPSNWPAIMAVTLLLTALIVLFLVAFALPNLRSAPQGIPVALSAPAVVAPLVTRGFESAYPGGFDIIRTENEAEARELILNRSAYGAFILDATSLTVLTASAASFAMASVLEAAAEQLSQITPLPVNILDVAPFTESDPRGIGLSAGALPIVLGGWIAAMGIIALIRGNRQRLIAAAAFALFGGFALTAVLQFWFGTFAGNYWLTSLAATMGIAATSFLVLGLQRLLSGAGIAVAAVLLILLGNPLSGLATAPELLPAPWGALGQLLPPGATGTLLRNVAFFDGAATATPLTTLALWTITGLALYFLASLVQHRKPVH